MAGGRFADVRQRLKVSGRINSLFGGLRHGPSQRAPEIIDSEGHEHAEPKGRRTDRRLEMLRVIQAFSKVRSRAVRRFHLESAGSEMRGYRSR